VLPARYEESPHIMETTTLETEMLRPEAAVRRVRRQTRELRDFQAHVTAYLLVTWRCS